MRVVVGENLSLNNVASMPWCSLAGWLQVSKKEEEIRSKTMSQFGGGGNDDGMQDG